MSRILISYRREDSAGHAGRLYDMLVEHFGADNVFMDIDTIAPGEDFVEVIRSAVSSAETVIALIGRQWLTVTNPGGQRRLDDPDDFVRLELVTALERKIRVVPVLVQGATMPGAKDLPAPLAPLARRNAVEVGDARFRRDVQALIGALVRGIAMGGRARLALARIRGSPLVLAGVFGVLSVAGLTGWLLFGGNRARAPVVPIAATRPVAGTSQESSPVPKITVLEGLAASSPAPASPTPAGSTTPPAPPAVSPTPESEQGPKPKPAAKTEPGSPDLTRPSEPPRMSPPPSQLQPTGTVSRQNRPPAQATVKSSVAKRIEESPIASDTRAEETWAHYRERVQVLAERRLRDEGLLREAGAADIGVTVNVSRDRTVTLIGVLRDAAQRDRATSLVRDIPGVVQVHASINVREGWR